jgi:galactokinase
VSDEGGRSGAVVAAFRARFHAEPSVFSAPGRVNLIGEHTDYNDGFVLPIAIADRTYVAATARADDSVRVYSRELDRERRFALKGEWRKRDDFGDYVEGVARALMRRGVAVPGADLYLTSEVPLGAGLSSSAALELALGLALTTLARSELSPRELALVGHEAENDFVGVRSGVMDQFASALGRSGHALFIDCRSLEVTPVPLPKTPVSFVICDTRVRHAHAESGYNARRDECLQAVELLQRAGRAVRSLREIGIEELGDTARLLPESLARRVRHVVRENGRTSAAVDALRRGHLAAFGRLMNGSHASLRDDYEVSVPELDFVVGQAQREPGVIGARMTGGGFGGSAVVLVDSADVERLCETLRTSFSARFGHEPGLRLAVASDGVRREPDAPR